jgi:hypothetical protein
MSSPASIAQGLSIVSGTVLSSRRGLLATGDARNWSMIRKSGNRISEKTLLNQKDKATVWFNSVESDSRNHAPQG